MSADDEIEALEIRRFLEAIHARYGYDLRNYAAPSIRRRVLAAVAKSAFRSVGELQHHVLKDAPLFARVVEDLTVRVSDMFRDPSFYATLRTRVTPVLRTYPQLKIWHSGCATGEEVYSGAIMLTEEGLYERSQIYATDLSVTGLEHAKQGLYAADRLEAFTDNYKQSGGTSDLSEYATRAYERVAFRENLRKNVVFFQHDLVGDHVFGEMHVIFCRNVLLYFEPALRERVIDKLAESLCPGGFLCLGGAERLRRVGAREAFVEFAPDDRIYRRQR
jgi:chemotaxis protein methyltransferase CheR